MPSPVGHTMTAFTIAYLYESRKEWWGNWINIAEVLIISILPDLDFLPGLYVGKLNLYHHGITHTLFFCVLITFLYWFYIRLRKFSSGREHLIPVSMVFIILASHIFLDGLCVDSTSPFGLKIFWPFYLNPIDFNYEVLGSLRKENVSGLFNKHNFLTVIREVYVLYPWCLTAILIKRWSVKKRQS